jgi:hypothetical protein
MSKRRNTALAVLALAAAAIFVLPAGSASAGSASVSNACANSVTANFSQIEVTTSGDDGLTTVAPGGATTTTGLSQEGAVPGAIFVAGYNLGLLVVGENNIPATVNTKIEGTNTTQLQQTTNNASTSVTTTITDPDGTPGTGDETGTDATFTANYNNLSWTAGASGTINYRQDSIAAWPATDANNTLRIQAVVGGFLNVIFRCAPGTVTPPDPGTVALIDPAGSFDTTAIGVVEVDDPPVANAGVDQTVDENTLVTLNGTGSTDPEGETLTFDWTAPAGVTLSDPTAASPTFTAPDVAAQTMLTFTLEVCDEADPTSLCDTDTVVITVNPEVVEVDDPPTANAGTDQTVTENTLVTLAGSGTDPEGETLTFDWTAPAGVTLSDPTAASPTFTAPDVAAQTMLTFTLEVCDEADPTSLCDTDTVVITVNPEVVEVDDPPVANAGPDQTVASGATVNLTGAGSSDPEGEALTYAWTAPAGVTLSDPTSAMPTFTAPAGPATLTFTLEVCDEADPTSLCDTDTVVVNVQAPVVGKPCPPTAGPKKKPHKKPAPNNKGKKCGFNFAGFLLAQ